MSRPVLHHGDAIEWARNYEGPLFHALLADPPYHLTSITERFGKDGSAPAKYGTDGVFQRASKGFMGQQWDGGDLAFRPETWAAFLPLLHPGAWCMAFASSRGWHRMAVAIEDAGFLLHPTLWLYWSYGSGFPKATRIDTQIDAAADPHLDATQYPEGLWGDAAIFPDDDRPVSDLARAWAGHRYGLQALKPAVEPIIVFQKPYAGRPVDSMVATGAGALWIDGARIGTDEQLGRPQSEQHFFTGLANNGWNDNSTGKGRWPANLLLQHHPACEPIGERRVRSNDRPNSSGNTYAPNRELYGKFNDGTYINRYADADGYETITAWACHPQCSVRRLGEQSGESYSSGGGMKDFSASTLFLGNAAPNMTDRSGLGDTGTAARFFHNSDWMAERLEAADPVVYQAKASTAEREAGLSGRQRSRWNDGRLQQDKDYPSLRGATDRLNSHATIKPLKLCQHLATLLLPPALYAPRRLFVPFAGVCSEMIGAMFAGWEHIDGIELEREHVDIGMARLAWWHRMMQQTHSTDLDAILRRYGAREKPHAPASDEWPAGTLFAEHEDQESP